MTDVNYWADPAPAPPAAEGISFSVGGRSVVSHGTLVLGAGDSAAVIHLDNLSVNIVFLVDPGSLSVDVQPVGDSALRVRFTGTPNPFGALYELPNMVVWRNTWLHLAMMIHAIQDGSTGRQIGFTITGTMEAI